MIDDIKPEFFIVGAPKCGTTSLYTYLRGHPGAYLPAEKEPMFFSKDHFSPGAIHSLGAYEKLFKACRQDQIAGEASANYLYSERAAGEIRAYQPAAKIIIMLRHPIKMMHSLHSQLVFMGLEPERDFGRALQLEIERKNGRHRPPNAQPYQSLLYRHIANYTEHTMRYLREFGTDSMHIIVLEEFVQDPDAEYKKTLNFIGLEETLPESWSAVNKNKETRSTLFRDLSQSRLSKAIARRLLPRRLRHELDALSRRINARETQRPGIPPELFEQLVQEFNPQVAELESLLGRDFRCWNMGTSLRD